MHQFAGRFNHIFFGFKEMREFQLYISTKHYDSPIWVRWCGHIISLLDCRYIKVSPVPVFSSSGSGIFTLFNNFCFAFPAAHDAQLIVQFPVSTHPNDSAICTVAHALICPSFSCACRTLIFVILLFFPRWSQHWHVLHGIFSCRWQTILHLGW